MYRIEKYRYRLHESCRCRIVKPAVSGLIIERTELIDNTTS